MFHNAYISCESETGALPPTGAARINAPLISVIVPVYNVAAYLSTCLDSIIHQSYPHLEIILINDGSLDESGDICEAYALRDKRIKVLHVSNGGQAKARNIGIRMATGTYLSFIDSDDWIELDMYEQAIKEFLYDEKLAVVRFGYQKCFADGTKWHRELFFSDVTLSGQSILESHIDECGMDGVMCSSLYKRSLLVEEDLFYYEGLVHEDEMLSLCIAIALSQSTSGACVKQINAIKYNYRKDIPSTVSQLTLRHVQDVCVGFNLVCDYAQGFRSLDLGILYRKILLMLGYYTGCWRQFGISLSAIARHTATIRQRIDLNQIRNKRGRWLLKLYCYSPRIYYYVERVYAPLARRLGISSRYR